MFVSDFETAFPGFENHFLIICFCFVMIVFFCDCRFDLNYPIVCLCGIITRSYLLFLIKQICDTIACLLIRLSLDIRIRMMGAVFGLEIFNFLNFNFYAFCVVILSWGIGCRRLMGWRASSISICEIDFLLSRD